MMPAARYGWTGAAGLGRLLRGRVRRNFAWATLGTAASRGGQAVGMMAAARLLGPEEFGRLGLIYATAFTAVTILGTGIATGIVRYVARDRHRDPDAVGRVVAAARVYGLAWCVAIAGLAVAGAPGAGALLGDQLTSAVILLAVLYTVLSLLIELEGAILTAHEDFRSRAALGAVAGVASGLGIALGAAQVGLSGALAGLVTGAAIGFALHLWASSALLRREQVRVLQAPRLAELRALGGSVLAVSAADFLMTAAGWLALVILARAPGGIQEVGVFSAARQWLIVASFLPLMLTRAALPAQAELAGGDATAARRFSQRQARNVIAMTAPSALLIAVLSPWLMPIYGPGYAHGWPALALLMAAITVQSPASVLQAYLLNRGAAALLLLIAAAAATVTLIGVLAFAHLGAAGIATALLLGAALRSALLAAAVR